MVKSVEILQDIIDSVIAVVGNDARLLKKLALVSSSVRNVWYVCFCIPKFFVLRAGQLPPLTWLEVLDENVVVAGRIRLLEVSQPSVFFCLYERPGGGQY